MINKFGIGIDSVDLESFQTRMTHTFITRILSEEEQACYNALSHPQRKLEYAAGRFAVKEAFVKAVKKVVKGLNFKDISVLNDEDGAPYLKIPHYDGYAFDISITHTKTIAMAVVCILKKG